MARRAGLLHDIGKAISHELGGSHTDIGVELCKRYGEPEPVLNAIKAHHNEEPVKFPEVALVCALRTPYPPLDLVLEGKPWRHT
jgi:ribonuclease Y